MSRHPLPPHELGAMALDRCHPCPECDKIVLMTDNGVWLETGSKPLAECQPMGMQVAPMAGGLWALYDGTHPRGHELHEHQPPETNL